MRGPELWAGRAAILTHQPHRAVADLSDEVRDLRLPKGTESSLLAKLRAAARALDRGANAAATGALDAFVKEVRAQRGKKIAKEVADGLTEFSKETIDLLAGE